MKFRLFSRIEFEVPYPIALIECFCFQTNFYANYDLLIPTRSIEDVGKIGARIEKSLLPKCKDIADTAKNVGIFKYDLDKFLEMDDAGMAGFKIDRGARA